jgi:phospholipid/cholesterol/gamma-HCH transport system substrate-binding protein
MQKSTTRDFLVGLFVLIGLGAIGYLSLTIGGLESPGRGGIALFAKFDEVADLKARAPVQLAGVTVGQVTGIKLDSDYRARVDIIVESNVELPVDSSASVVTAGLLGDRYIALQPGAEEEYLKNGEEIAYTQSAMVLENLVGKFLVNVEDKDDKGKSGNAAESADKADTAKKEK